MNIAVDVQAVILAGENHAAVIHQRHVEALGMLDFALERRHQLPVLSENRQVEVVVIVGDEDFSARVDSHTDGVVGDAFASDLPQESSLIVEDLDAVRAVIANENLLFVVDDDAVRELEVLAAAELLQNISVLIENNDTHDFALDHNDAPLAVDCDAARVLQNIRAELADKLAVLIVDLDLMRGRPFRDDDIARCADNSHSVGVQQLAVAFATLAKLELEAALLVKYLNAVIVGVGHDDVVLSVDSDTAGLCKLPLHDTELAELAVIYHLLTLDLRFGWENRRRHQLGRDVEHRVGVVRL